MRMPVTLKRIKELEYEARRTGHTEKRAAWSEAKREYERLKTALFDEETPYADSPADDYVERLRIAAESGEEVAVMRYEMMRERREKIDRGIRWDDARELRAMTEELRRVLESGEKVMKKHVEAASRVAMDFGSTDNRVLYSAMKARYEAQKDGSIEHSTPDDPPKVTEEDIKDAGEKARISGRIEDRVHFATLKQKMREQEEVAQ